MPDIPENNHYCWSKKCSKCGIINRGCVRFNVFCYNCQEPLILFDTYPQSNLQDLFISPEAIKELNDWMPSGEILYKYSIYHEPQNQFFTTT
jgi:hypothetical protein